MQRFKDMNKVVDMGGRRQLIHQKVSWAVTQVGQKGMFDNIFARMQKDMGKNIKEVKNKKPDPDEKSNGWSMTRICIRWRLQDADITRKKHYRDS